MKYWFVAYEISGGFRGEVYTRSAVLISETIEFPASKVYAKLQDHLESNNVTSPGYFKCRSLSSWKELSPELFADFRTFTKELMLVNEPIIADESKAPEIQKKDRSFFGWFLGGEE